MGFGSPGGGVSGRNRGAGTLGGGGARPPSSEAPAARQARPGQGPRRVGTTGSGPSRGPASARPPRLGVRWTHSSRGHQPDSPRGRLRRQTAMHRALPPAPAPQPACAIARPPARGLPRANIQVPGRPHFPLAPGAASAGPRNPDDQRGATLQPAPLRRRGYPGSRGPGEPRSSAPALLTAGRRGDAASPAGAPGEGVVTSRRRVEAAVAIATGRGGRGKRDRPAGINAPSGGRSHRRYLGGGDRRAR